MADRLPVVASYGKPIKDPAVYAQFNAAVQNGIQAINDAPDEHRLNAMSSIIVSVLLSQENPRLLLAQFVLKLDAVIRQAENAPPHGTS